MTGEFEDRIARYCAEHGMFPGSGGTHVLVALSGGGDSVALLHILRAVADELGIVTITAAHLNHALRGEDADGDERYCRGMCGELGIPIVVETCAPGELTSAGGSLETAARNRRIAFLETTAGSLGAHRIATGHTLSDQCETVLFRLLRGTGPQGLAGIHPVRPPLWIRPLLDVSRSEVRRYLDARNIPFREDATNSDTQFMRNRIRHELVPYIRERFAPAVDTTVARLAELSRIQEAYLGDVTRDAMQRCAFVNNPYKILLDKQVFMGYHKVLKQRVLRECLGQLEGPGRHADSSEVEQILAMAETESGPQDITGGIRVGVDAGVVAFTVNTPAYAPVPVKCSGETVLPGGYGTIAAREAENDERVDGRTSILLDSAETGRLGKLTVGPVHGGETMLPFGGTSPLKINDALSDAAVPRVLRDEYPVLRAGATPLWIPGVRSAEHLRIGKEQPGETVRLDYLHGVCRS